MFVVGVLLHSFVDADVVDCGGVVGFHSLEMLRDETGVSSRAHASCQ